MLLCAAADIIYTRDIFMRYYQYARRRAAARARAHIQRHHHHHYRDILHAARAAIDIITARSRHHARPSTARTSARGKKCHRYARYITSYRIRTRITRDIRSRTTSHIIIDIISFLLYGVAFTQLCHILHRDIIMAALTSSSYARLRARITT